MPEIVTCSECHKQLRVPDNMLGKRVKCPACGTIFMAAAPAAEEEPPPAPAKAEDEELESDAGEAPATPEEEEEEAPRRPRRRSRRDDDDEDDDLPMRRGDSGLAASRVMGPSIALMIVGGLALLLALVGLLLNLMGAAVVAGGAGAAGRPGAGGSLPPVAQAFSGVLGAVLGLCWGGIVLSGAIQMKNLKSYGYALAGTIVAMLPCNLCCLLGLPFGIWALVVLMDQEVKSAFR